MRGLAKGGVGPRFERNIDKTATCWDWIGNKDAGGYGMFSIYQVPLKAHRFSWEWYIGPIPYGMHVLHHCDNPGCVRPDHLFIGTQADNNRDRAAKERNRPKSTYPHPTHCERGHEFSPENTWTTVKGHRHCRACHRLRDRARAERAGHWPKRKRKQQR
jgi:hypothetical protein